MTELDGAVKLFGNFVFPIALSVYLIVNVSKQLATQNMSLLRLVIAIEAVCRKLGINEGELGSAGGGAGLRDLKEKIGS